MFIREVSTKMLHFYFRDEISIQQTFLINQSKNVKELIERLDASQLFSSYSPNKKENLEMIFSIIYDQFSTRPCTWEY